MPLPVTGQPQRDIVQSLPPLIVVGPPTSANASSPSDWATICSKPGFLSAGMSPFDTASSTVHAVRSGLKPVLTDQMQFLVRESYADSTASCGFSVAATMIGTTLALS